MKEIILWLFSQIGNFITVSLNWKIYGDFSFTHFLLGFLLLYMLYKLYIGNFLETLGITVNLNNKLFNAENELDKKNYYTQISTGRVISKYGSGRQIETATEKYRVNSRTGKSELLGKTKTKEFTVNKR